MKCPYECNKKVNGYCSTMGCFNNKYNSQSFQYTSAFDLARIRENLQKTATFKDRGSSFTKV